MIRIVTSHIVFLVMYILIFFIYPTSAQTIIPKGDVNTDNHITVADAQLTLKHAIGITINTWAGDTVADVNCSGGDNSVSAADALLMLRVSLSLSVDAWCGDAHVCTAQDGIVPNMASETRTRYASSTVPYGQTCQSQMQTKTCTNGSWGEWSGGYTHGVCTIVDGLVAPWDAQKFRSVLSQSKLQWPHSSTDVAYGQFNGVATDYFNLSAVNDMIFNINHVEEYKDMDIVRVELRQGPESKEWQTSTNTKQTLTGVVLLTHPEHIQEYSWMQIHNNHKRLPYVNKPLLRLVWRADRSGLVDHLWAALKTDASGQHTTWIDLGQRPDVSFGTEISVADSMLTINVNGIQVTRDISYWSEHFNYYKAGIYISGSVNDGIPTNERNVTIRFRQLDMLQESLCVRADGAYAEDGDTETRTHYASSTVPYGQTCQSETQTRTCSNGNWEAWSGSYMEESCTVADLSIGAVSLVASTTEEEVVFDWASQKCEQDDIPDVPVRAIRTSDGSVHMLASHHTNKLFVGTDLNSVQKNCTSAMPSHTNGNPDTFDDYEWLHSLYRPIGTSTVYALIHDEFHGNEHDPNCNSYSSCWYNAITSAVSYDNAFTFTHATPTTHLVASIPYTYQDFIASDNESDRHPAGLFNPSNIITKGDGYYYTFLLMTSFGEHQAGTCLMRTQDLSDPLSWRAWDGNDFTVSFVNPYTLTAGESVLSHICHPVSQAELGQMYSSVVYSTYINKYILIGVTGKHNTQGDLVYGVYFSISDDLIHWEPRKLIFEAPVPQHRESSGFAIAYPSILDPQSTSQNFETMHDTAYLYFTRMYYNISGSITYHRDLIRVPIHIELQ